MYKRLLILISLLILAPAGVFGHITGNSVEKEFGEYVVDAGYDKTVTTEAPIRLDFNLWNTDKTQQVEFTRVWVRIAPEEGITLATYITTPGFGLAGMSYMFPKEGDYVVTARFEKGDKTLAEISFPLKVEGPPLSQKYKPHLILAGVGLIIGIISGFLIKKKFTPESL